jgi:hypothetical protein
MKAQLPEIGRAFGGKHHFRSFRTKPKYARFAKNWSLLLGADAIDSASHHFAKATERIDGYSTCASVLDHAKQPATANPTGYPQHNAVARL